MTLKTLPFNDFQETHAIMKKVVSANRALAELKGIVKTIPNEQIIINTLALQESKDSSEIEQIVTTHDDIYKSDDDTTLSHEGKEVKDYARALKIGTAKIKKQGMITNNILLAIVKMVKANDAGLRTTEGTKLKNGSGDVIYTPPQNPREIIELMSNLEKYINNNELDDLDPLVKMAIIHHQFESIHPFYDGNGRVGRILNILYLILNDLLDIPVLYMSGYIIKTKSDYYRLFQEVRDDDKWEDWVLYMLDAVEQTSKRTIETVKDIRDLMLKQKTIIRSNAEKIYSQELLNIIFSHPYTKIDFLVDSLSISRNTASRHLNKLVDLGVLRLHKIGRVHYYMNIELMSVLIRK
jgi:Fic family protein